MTRGGKQRALTSVMAPHCSATIVTYSAALLCAMITMVLTTCKRVRTENSASTTACTQR